MELWYLQCFSITGATGTGVGAPVEGVFMLSEQRLDLEFSTRTAQPLVLMDHPVFSVMPSVVRSLISTEASPITLVPGQEVPEGSLILVMKGLLGLFDAKSGAAVGVIGPQAVFAGVPHANHEPPTLGRAIVETQIYAVSLSVMSKTCGATWSHRFTAVHASSRARLMGVEQYCTESHSLTERLAKWCLRLAPSLLETDPYLTSACLAALVGMGQDELVETWAQLSAEGCLGPQPGDFKGTWMEGLRHRACSCDETLNDGGVERRSRRRLQRRH